MDKKIDIKIIIKYSKFKNKKLLEILVIIIRK